MGLPSQHKEVGCWKNIKNQLPMPTVRIKKLIDCHTPKVLSIDKSLLLEDIFTFQVYGIF